MAAPTETPPPGSPAPQHWAPPEPTWLQRQGEGRPWIAPTLVGVVVGLGTAYTAWQDPNGDGVFPQCPTQAVFGIDCPGCGGLRATHSLVHGDIAQAFDHNLIISLLLPLAGALWAVWMLRAVRSTLAARAQRSAGHPGARALPVRFPLRIPGDPATFWRVAIIVLVGFAVARNITSVPLLEYLHSDA